MRLKGRKQRHSWLCKSKTLNKVSVRLMLIRVKEINNCSLCCKLLHLPIEYLLSISEIFVFHY